MKSCIKLQSGWGRVVTTRAATMRPEFISDLKSIVKFEKQPMLPYGCGRSYGDVALIEKGINILTTRLNRLISFDANTLELVCESGVTLRDIQTTFLPRKIGLTTSPGTAWVTVGGAIANDVHGKNHDRVGSFGQHVVWFELVLASGEIIRCSRTENQAVFFATMGGLGLTGIITIVCLRLQKQDSAVVVHHEMISDLATLLSRLQAVRETSAYSVAWLDMAASLTNKGCNILSTAEPDSTVLELRSFHSHRLPSFCSHFLNNVSMRCFNRFYYYRAKQQQKSFFQSLPEFLYPLDAVENWNCLYGKKGFYQFQCVIPDDAANAGITKIINTVSVSQHMPYLAVLKTLGKEGEGLLSFPMRGFTLALDFPNKKNILTLLNQLEVITLAHHGRIYLAKDASLSAEHFALMYPKLKEFQEVLNKIDPEQRWESMLSKRLNIRKNHD